MENKRNIKPISPFVSFCQKVIPLAYDESMSYYECLCALLNHIMKVDEAVNLNADAVTELQNYVKNYFDNLDVQDEINNKLDAMAQSGQLSDIIAQYLQLAGILAYNTLNDLKQATNIVNGSYVKTYGKNSLNDGYGRFYKIREIKNTDVVDGNHLIALNNYDTLVAELINNNTSTFVTPEMYGCIGNGEVDDTEKMQNCINDAISMKKPIFAFGNYLITKSLKLNGSITIYGNKNSISADLLDNEFTFIYTGNDYLFDTDLEYNTSLFENISIKGNETNKCFKNTGYRNRWNNVSMYNFAKGIHFYGQISIWRGENDIENCYFYNVNNAIEIDHKLYADSYIKGCTFKGGDYSIYGSFNAWVLSLSHDYSLRGINISNFANSQIINNYLDHSSHMPFIYASADISGGSIISNNKFLAGSGITDISSLIQINNNIGNYNLTIDNNVGSGEKYSNSYFVEFIGTSGLAYAMSGNQMFKIVGKLLKNYPLTSAGSMVNYGGYKSITNISGSANFNFCYFNNGVAHIILEVSNAGLTLGHLPFNPAISVRIPVFSIQKGTWGTALLNNSNGNITIPNNFTGDTVLINASYLVYYNGNFGDND